MSSAETGSSRWRQSALTILTVLSLAAIGYAGHATHWTFQFGSHDAVPHAPEVAETTHAAATVDASVDGKPETTVMDEGEVRIEFPNTDAVKRIGITSAEVVEKPLADEITSTGIVSYDERLVAQLSTRVEGTIWRVDRHLGETVRQGDILALVESEEVGRLKAEFLNALVGVETRQSHLKLLEEAGEAIAGRLTREAQSALREARIQLVNAEQALVNLGFEVAIDDFLKMSDEERAARVRTLSLPSELTDGRSPGRMTSNLVPLRAPFDGVVIGKDVVVGETVDPSKSTFEIADVRRMWIILDLTKEDSQRVSVGQPLRFRPDGLDQEVTGTVSWVSTEVDPQTRTLKARAEVDNPLLSPASGLRLLRSHTYGTGQILVQPAKLTRIAPRDCLHWDGEDWIVFVQSGDTTFESRRVDIGQVHPGFAELLTDIAPGTRLACLGSHSLKSELLLSQVDSKAL